MNTLLHKISGKKNELMGLNQNSNHLLPPKIELNQIYLRLI